jgi:acetylornithine deacetylase/succinyl-diaminopimelate desuccinylase-like protein
VELSQEQVRRIETAEAAIDEAFLLGLLKRLVETHSPTGREGPLAADLARFLSERGIPARYQAISETRGNCIGRLAGTGGGADLLLYGHLDATFTADPDEDRPVLGDEPRPDLQPRLQRKGDMLTGLGVANPKGGLACAIAALEAIVRTGGPLAGDVVLGIVAGGIHKRPIEALHRRYEGADYQGFGIGCEYMLKHGVTADFAISTKPGYGIVYEEPGECWFMVEVAGRLSYSGLRHVTEPRNPLVDAAELVLAIERWLPDYTRRFTLGQLAPQGAVGAIEGGWPFKPEFIPAVCRLYVNLHANAATSPLEVRRVFEAFLDSYRVQHPDVGLRCEMLLAQPGARTDPASWIVGCCRRALTAVEGRELPDVAGLSGTTDGNVLRQWGIPTVRLGLPGLMSPEAGLPSMFDAARLTDMKRLARVYVRAVIDTCLRTGLRRPT